MPARAYSLAATVFPFTAAGLGTTSCTVAAACEITVNWHGAAPSVIPVTTMAATLGNAIQVDAVADVYLIIAQVGQATLVLVQLHDALTIGLETVLSGSDWGIIGELVHNQVKERAQAVEVGVVTAQVSAIQSKMAICCPTTCLRPPGQSQMNVLAGGYGSGTKTVGGIGGHSLFVMPFAMAYNEALNLLYIVEFQYPPATSSSAVITKINATTGAIISSFSFAHAFGIDDGTVLSGGYLALASNGNLYYADTQQSIVHFFPAGGGGSSLTWNPLSSPGAALSYTPQLATGVQIRPAGIALSLDETLLYIVDAAHGYIAQYTIATGMIVAIAGTGAYDLGGTGDGGPASSAALAACRKIHLGKDNALYIGCGVITRIRRIDLATMIITTVAGCGTATYVSGGTRAWPNYTYDHAGYDGDGSSATAALGTGHGQLSYGEAAVMNSCGELIIADGKALRVVTPDGTIHSLAFAAYDATPTGGTNAMTTATYLPTGVTVQANTLGVGNMQAYPEQAVLDVCLGPGGNGVFVAVGGQIHGIVYVR